MFTQENINNLFDRQLQEWSLACSNYKNLEQVKVKQFDFGEFVVDVQFNPARIRSTAAKVDGNSIAERSCFLCSENLPEEQESLLFSGNYNLLVNPYPIFPMHFTIPACLHILQLITGRYEDMLDLARQMEGYILFYNGSKCGASAPDHMHFQAGSKGFLPLEKDIYNTYLRELIYENIYIRAYSFKDYLRNGFLIEAKDKDVSLNFFEYLYALLEVHENHLEPMLNILVWYEGDRWFTSVFPRQKHRPECFYEENERHLLISPASVDFGGVFIVPREEDFEKITKEDIITILGEVSIEDDKMKEIVDVIRVNQ